ncbi:MAG: AraC family transcriptional regulator [Oceanococcaceae bacterium]
MTRTDWEGDIVFSHNVAIFRGHVGDNRLHSHWASQLTVALDAALAYETADGTTSSKAVYFPSKTAHRLISGHVCSFYFDPLSDVVTQLLNIDSQGGWCPLSRDQLPVTLAEMNPSADLGMMLSDGPLSTRSRVVSEDLRLKAVLKEIRSQLAEGASVDRDALATLVHLSPTRFSHWFVEQTGVPLRSYKKWLKLRVAIDALLEGKNPMEAAMLSGFSDLAHMSRAFSDSFGLTYLDARRALENSHTQEFAG